MEGRMRKIKSNESGITENAENEFLRLWHAYHAKRKIPYSHDDAKDMFYKLTLIFWEDK